jgi:hypothetical protein
LNPFRSLFQWQPRWHKSCHHRRRIRGSRAAAWDCLFGSTTPIARLYIFHRQRCATCVQPVPLRLTRLLYGCLVCGFSSNTDQLCAACERLACAVARPLNGGGDSGGACCCRQASHRGEWRWTVDRHQGGVRHLVHRPGVRVRPDGKPAAPLPMQGAWQVQRPPCNRPSAINPCNSHAIFHVSMSNMP